MPNRGLREGITTSERINSLAEPWAEVLYYRLLTCVDDFGLFDARPRIVQSRVFPLRSDVSEDDIQSWLVMLRDARLIKLYQANGKPFLMILKWQERIRANAPKHPLPSGYIIKEEIINDKGQTRRRRICSTKGGEDADIEKDILSPSIDSSSPSSADGCGQMTTNDARGTRYEVRGTRFEVRGTRNEGRGSRFEGSSAAPSQDQDQTPGPNPDLPEDDPDLEAFLDPDEPEEKARTGPQKLDPKDPQQLAVIKAEMKERMAALAESKRFGGDQA